MADDRITIFFEPKGDKELVKAINALARAQKRLGKTSKDVARGNMRQSASSKKATKSFNALGGTMSVLRSRLLVYTFALGLANKVIGTFVRAAMKQEDAEKKLAVQLGFTSTALKDYASELQKVTQFGDEETLAVMGQISAFTKNEEQIKALTQATLDLSEGMGIGLQEAGLLVGKTFGSTTNSLSRYGISVKGTVGSTKRLESLTRSVEDKYGGLSKKIDTTSKALKQMKNALGDASEEIGEAMLPAVKQMAISFTKAVQDKIIPAIEKVKSVDFSATARNFLENGQVILDFLIGLAGILPKIMVIIGANFLMGIYEHIAKPLQTFFGGFSGELKDLVFNNFKVLGLEATRAFMGAFNDMIDLAPKLFSFLGIEKFDEGLNIIKEMITETQIDIGDNRLFRVFKKNFEKDIFDTESAVAAFGENYRETIGKLIEWQQEKIEESGGADGEDKGFFSKLFGMSDEQLEGLMADVKQWQTAIMGVANTYEKMKLQGIENARQTELDAAKNIKWEKKRNLEIENINEKYDKKVKARKEKMKTVKIAEAISNTALGITKAFIDPGGIGGWLLSAMIAATGAMNIEIIKGQKYQYGGVVGGRRHSQGGTMIEAERGEFVMSRNAVDAVGIETMNRINQGGGAGSVNISFNGNVMSKDFIEDEAIPQIKEAIRRGADIGVG